MKYQTKYYIGHATNSAERYKASSGGVGTMLMKFVLSTNKVGTALTFVFNPKLCKYEPKLVYSSNEINICGSIYHDIDILYYLKNNLAKVKNNIVLSCPPCQVNAIRSFLAKRGIQSIIISFCCSGQLDITATWDYLKFLKIDTSQIVKLQYRGNGWPSGIQVWTKKGLVLFKENYTEPWKTLHKSMLYKPKRCFLCKLDTSYTADFSLGDPWLKEYIEQDNVGNSIFLINTQKAMSIFEEILKSNKIKCKEIDRNIYEQAQTTTIGKKNTVLSDKKYLIFMSKLVHNRIYHYIFRRNMLLIRCHLWIKSILYKIYYHLSK